MSSPSAQLQAALAATREALDAGSLTRLRASRLVARHCRASLRRYPFDRELGLAVSHMASRDFIPPQPASLPAGDHDALRVLLSGWTDDELALLTQSQVTWPDPSEAPEEALRVLTLFLAVKDEHERASALLDVLKVHIPPQSAAMATFRLEALRMPPEERGEAEQWHALLAPLRALGEPGADALRQGLALAASALIEASTDYGAEWIQPVLGGEVIVNLNLALKRRPALRDALAPAVDWIEESQRIEPLAITPLHEVLEGLEVADSQGDFEAGSAQLDAALTMSAERHDFVQALAARAAALGDRGMAARASLLGAHVPPFSSRLIKAPHAITAPPATTLDWRHALTRLAAPDVLPTTTDECVFLEEAGSRTRAARGWFALGHTAALLQAARLSDALSPAERATLTAAVRSELPNDELELKPDDEALALALFSRLSASEERTLWSLRLGAIAAENDAIDEGESSSVEFSDVDDPHSVANRLAAAEDLFDAGNLGAASAILAALLRHDDTEAHHSALIVLVIRALRVERPEQAMVSGASRAVLGQKAPGPQLLDALINDAMAAYALHEVLHQGALDRRRPDLQRVRLLEAWLGIWAATSTAPDPAALHDLMHIDPILLPLAASRLGGWSDPVAEAAAFMKRFPPLETTAGDYGDALLEHITSAPQKP